MLTSKDYIEQLDLKPHPEGGYFSEIYCSNITVRINSGKDKNLPDENRNLATSIFYLLEKDQISGFHQLKSDEIWYFHTGSPLLVYCIKEGGKLQVYVLGIDIPNGHIPQLIIPAGTIFGAELKDKNSFSLIGCMVTPGFKYDDFILYSRKELLEKYPQHTNIINKLTH